MSKRILSPPLIRSIYKKKKKKKETLKELCKETHRDILFNKYMIMCFYENSNTDVLLNIFIFIVNVSFRIFRVYDINEIHLNIIIEKGQYLLSIKCNKDLEDDILYNLKYSSIVYFRNCYDLKLYRELNITDDNKKIGIKCDCKWFLNNSNCYEKLNIYIKFDENDK
jgi:hypothetical protein